MKDRDLATGKLKVEPENIETEPEIVEEDSIGDVKPTKKKGK
jgi:hypothetical protein